MSLKALESKERWACTCKVEMLGGQEGVIHLESSLPVYGRGKKGREREEADAFPQALS